MINQIMSWNTNSQNSKKTNNSCHGTQTARIVKKTNGKMVNMIPVKYKILSQNVETAKAFK